MNRNPIDHAIRALSVGAGFVGILVFVVFNIL